MVTEESGNTGIWSKDRNLTQSMQGCHTKAFYMLIPIIDLTRHVVVLESSEIDEENHFNQLCSI